MQLPWQVTGERTRMVQSPHSTFSDSEATQEGAAEAAQAAAWPVRSRSPEPEASEQGSWQQHSHDRSRPPSIHDSPGRSIDNSRVLVSCLRLARTHV